MAFPKEPRLKSIPVFGALISLFLIVIPETVPGQPRPLISQTRHDFGRVREDMVLRHRFVVKNIGDQDLKVVDIDPDCVCTVPSYDKVIPPGQEGHITLELQPFSVLDVFEKKTRVRFNDPGGTAVTLVLTGVAQKSLEIQPSPVIRLKGGPAGEVSAEVRLISHLPFPWEITKVETSIPDKIDLILIPKKPGREYLLVVKNRMDRPERYRGRIEIHSNLLHRPKLVLRVFGDLYPDSEDIR